jgi:hypothetical protein
MRKPRTDLEKFIKLFKEANINFVKYTTNASVQLEIPPEFVWCGGYSIGFLFTQSGKFCGVKPVEEV